MEGARPNSKVVSRLNAAAKANTVQLTSISSGRWISGGFSASIAWTHQCASTSPAVAPVMETSKDSAINCRTMRVRVAPSASRIEISRDRKRGAG